MKKRGNNFIKCFRIYTEWTNDYDTEQYYEFRLGYAELGKLLRKYVDEHNNYSDELKKIEVKELEPTFEAIWTCFRKTCSYFSGEWYLKVKEN